MNFNEFGLSPAILKSLDEQEYKNPTPIQQKAIPAIMNGKDVMAAAQTGTGKTAGFTLPILDHLSKGQRANTPGCVRALVLTPTRELAMQVAESVATYGKYLSLSSTVVFGGVKINPQMNRLHKGVDILVATPGRLLDLYQQNAMNFSKLEVLVLDEADRMLDMGFIHDIKKIIHVLPKKRQNLLFSATFSNDIRALAKPLMNRPEEISVSAPNTTVHTVKQWVHTVDKKQKPALLSHIIWEGRWEQVLVFAKTKHGANRLAEYLIQDGMTAAAIHGNKSQGARTRALGDFKKGLIRVLVATDVAARGLDIELLPHVVNFDLPHVPHDYVHRIGRTGRAGASGEAISLVSADEFQQLADIERLINQKLTRKTVDGFEAKHVVPDRPVNDARRALRVNHQKKNDGQYQSKSRANYMKQENKQEWPKKNRPRRSEWSEKAARPARFERTTHSDYFSKSERPTRNEHPVKGEWKPRVERAVRAEFSERSEKSFRGKRSFNNNKTARGERNFNNERPARAERSFRDEKSTRNERIFRSESTDRDQKHFNTKKPVYNKQASNKTGFDRRERSSHNDRSTRSTRFNGRSSRSRPSR